MATVKISHLRYSGKTLDGQPDDYSSVTRVTFATPREAADVLRKKKQVLRFLQFDKIFVEEDRTQKERRREKKHQQEQHKFQAIETKLIALTQQLQRQYSPALPAGTDTHGRVTEWERQGRRGRRRH